MSRRRQATTLHHQSRKKGLEQDAPRTRPVAPASGVYTVRTLLVRPQSRGFISRLFAQKHKFRFSLPCTDYSILIMAHYSPADCCVGLPGLKSPPPNLPRPLQAPKGRPHGLHVPEGATDGTYHENTT